MHLTNDQIIRFQKSMTNFPLVALLIANALPVVGVLCFGWDAFAIVLLYWTENIVVGFYNVLKMVFVKESSPAISKHSSISNLEFVGIPIKPGKYSLILFFIIHYGGFTLGHGLAVIALFNNDAFPSELTWPCFLVFLQAFIYGMFNTFSRFPANILIGIVCLFASHGISFVYNYFYRDERSRTSLQELMGQPYARIVVLQITIIFGGWLTMAMGSPVGVLLILVLLKTIIDIKLHLRERKKNQTIEVNQT